MSSISRENQINKAFHQMDWITKLKKNYSILPMILFAATGVSFGVAAMIHALKAPDVGLANRKANPEPWNKYEHKQFKHLNPAHHDYEHIPAPPKYKDS